MYNSICVFPFAGIVCLTYGKMVHILPRDDEWDPMEHVWRFIAGAVAGVETPLFLFFFWFLVLCFLIYFLFVLVCVFFSM